MRKRPIQAALALSLSMWVVTASLAQQPTKPARARAELVSSASTIAAGTPFTVAIAFDVDQDWHLYWKDPGDSGMPPSVKWRLPEGFQAGELQFPKPETLKTSAGVNYIHEKQFALLVTITPPADLKAGQTLELAGDLQWLECDADICLPAKQSVKLSVMTGDRPAPANKERFEVWEAAVEAGRGYDPKKAE